MAGITLYQFPASHFNEKARWTLERKGVPHRRVSLMPGPHAPRMKRLTGATQTPALVDGVQVVPGSAAIIDHLERRFPEPPLYPEDPVLRERALAIQRRFDDEVGPAVRLAKFFEVMSADYATRTFCGEKPALVRALYRASFPLVAGIMRRSMGIDAPNAERARERTRAALAFVAEAGEATGHLVGDAFSVADLAAAALLMPAVDVSAWGGPPTADCDAERAWLARWADHPGAEWVRETYRRYRQSGDPCRSTAGRARA